MSAPEPWGAGMRRRFTTSGKASKARRGKALNPKGRIGSAAPRDGGSSTADLKEQFDRLLDELAEARKRLAELWSSRPRPPRCSKSSTPQLASLSPFLMLCCKTRCTSATQVLATYCSMMETCFGMSRFIMLHRLGPQNETGIPCLPAISLGFFTASPRRSGSYTLPILP